MKHIKKIGWFFIILSLLVLVPFLESRGEFLRLFKIDVLMNMIYVLTGILALIFSHREKRTNMFFRIFGVVYFLVAIFGFIGVDNVLGVSSVNLATNILNSFFAVVFIFFTFFKKDLYSIFPKKY